MVRKWGFLPVVGFLVALSTSVWGQGVLSSIGAPHEKNLEELLEKNQPEDAARYWGENRSYFWDNAERLKPLLARLKSAVNERHEPRMAAAEAALKPLAAAPLSLLEWSKVIRAVSDARSALDAYRALPIVIDDSLRSERFVALEGALGEVVNLYVANAPKAFAEYDHFGSPLFARTYPVEVSDEVVGAGYAALRPKLEKASGEQIAKFRDAYGKVLAPRQREELARYASLARYRELVPDGKITAESGAKLISEITAGKLDAAMLPIKLAFFWSGEAAKSGDFAVALNPPASLAIGEVRRQEISAKLAGLDIAVFIDTDKTSLAKNAKATRQEYSQFKSSTRQVLNPAYLDAQALVQRMQVEQVRAEGGGGMSFSLDPISLVAGLAKEAYRQGKTMVARTNLKTAEDQLASTPRMINEDVMGDYTYQVADVEVTRKVPLAVYIIDVKNGGYLKAATELTEKRRFETAEGLHPRDPERENLLARYATPKTMQEYASSPAKVEAMVVLTAAMNSLQDVGGGTRPIAALPQDLDRGATLGPPIAAALAAGQCDAFFDTFIEQLKASRQCAADPESVKGLVERVRGEATNAAEMGILTAARTPELYKIVPENDERWLMVGDTAQPNCAAPIAIRNPQDSYAECVRVLSCGARTVACGRELTRQNRAMGCPEASQRCMVVYPIPQ